MVALLLMVLVSLLQGKARDATAIPTLKFFIANIALIGVFVAKGNMSPLDFID